MIDRDVGSERSDAVDRHSAEREMDPVTQARLAYRLQHLKTVRKQRQAREYWEQELAMQARGEHAMSDDA